LVVYGSFGFGWFGISLLRLNLPEFVASQPLIFSGFEAFRRLFGTVASRGQGQCFTGLLTNRQVLHCMAKTVSRLSDNLPYVPSKEDYWIRETIMALYRGFGERFLASFPESPEGHSFVLTSLLEWLIAKHAVRPHRLSYHGFGYGDWDFIISDVGMMYLEKEFPEVRRQGSLELPSPEEWESKPGWLESVADQLTYCLPTVPN
jgi:hypothetical protein